MTHHMIVKYVFFISRNFRVDVRTVEIKKYCRNIIKEKHMIVVLSPIDETVL